MSDMQTNETIERFVEGMKKASARARELGAAQQNKDWQRIAEFLDGIRAKGVTLCKSRALGRQEVLGMLDHRQKGETVN